MTKPPTETIIISDDDDDEMEEVKYPPGPSRIPFQSRSNGNDGTVKSENGGLDWEAKDVLRVALSKLDAEIQSVAAQLKPLQELHTSLIAERRDLEQQLSTSSHSHSNLTTSSSNPHTKPNQKHTIDYETPNHPWSPALLTTLQNTFSLSSFRLCQQGVINAAMDSRDIVCVMPTGGGKSLTYQLPAVIGRGVTVVVSPLLALIWDQVRGLKEIGVECVMLTGTTSKHDQNEAYERMKSGPKNGQKEIKLCYVTPEKIAKSKHFMSVLEKVNSDGRLKRFVIDEAHCCSQLGHDFRPDYKKLSVLKTLFPRVPIQAVTATLSSKTLPDLLKILRLGPICDGRAANSSGTVFFSAPLYRPNLLYKVLPKPSNSKAAIDVMREWITIHHPNESGIIYCLSKKDAETVADALKTSSNGAIKTGVYHAGVGDSAKERIHVDWRNGRVNVICATIAFGLGIDKGDVRYVIHHSMSKSLDGYYQETGRAGRDGKQSDCVLFYRGQDVSRLSSLIYGDVDGSSKLQEMVRFAQDLKTCRKVAFAKYFSTSSSLSTNAWDHADALSSNSGTIQKCGKCDNCLRLPESLITEDVTEDTWKILTILQDVLKQGGRATLGALADLARGLGGGSFGVQVGGKGKKRRNAGGGEEKGFLDLRKVGGKVSLGKDDMEVLLINLVLEGYLDESFSPTSYTVNTYLVPSSQAIRLTRLTREEISSPNNSIKVECTFLNPKSGPSRLKKTSLSRKGSLVVHSDEDDYFERSDTEDLGEAEGGETNNTKGKGKGKGKTKAGAAKTKPAKPQGKAATKKRKVTVTQDEDREDEYEDFDMEMMAVKEDHDNENENGNDNDYDDDPDDHLDDEAWPIREEGGGGGSAWKSNVLSSDED